MIDPAAPSVGEVEAIAAMADPVQRNLRITAIYAELSAAFAQWLPAAANWCTFATWASRQAGCTIRREDLARVIADRLRERILRKRILPRAPDLSGASFERLAAIAGDISDTLPGIDRASAAVGVGNRKVFAEIGREFARFLSEASGSVPAFVERLRPGPPPEGQDLLRRAFTNYQAARDTVDAGSRAQLVLLANVQIGLHEQTRLQPEIREAMDAALLDVADVRRRLLDRLDLRIAVGPIGRTRPGRSFVNQIADEISEELRAVTRIVITDHLMSIGLSHGRTLRLGTDASASAPSSLATLSNHDLVSLLRAHDAMPDSPGGSGAVDWSVLAQRIKFIADFFRGFQEDLSLFDPPFPAGLG